MGDVSNHCIDPGSFSFLSALGFLTMLLKLIGVPLVRIFVQIAILHSITK